MQLLGALSPWIIGPYKYFTIIIITIIHKNIKIF